jgi:stage II sporulation protein D
MLTRHKHTRLSRAGLSVTGMLAATALVLAGAPSGAAAIQIPDHATLKITGHGFGHGHGLSQYGAQGAAKKGLTGQQIVHFYYPHTKSGHVGGSVKVLITADTDSRTTVVNRTGLAVHDLGRGGKTTLLPAKGVAGRATQWRLSPGRNGATQVAYRNAGWHTWRTLAGDGEFRSAKPITLVVGSARVTYRGSLQSRTPPPQTSTLRRVTVNKVPLDAYVQGVVPREMPALWEQAALRAQAVAARTYAAFEAGSSTNPRWNLCDTSQCQVYGGESAEFPTSNEAVAKTKGQVRMFHRKPAFTQFSSSNGGWESAGGKPYLPAQKDPYEKLSGNPNHTWTAKVSARTIEKAWPQLGNLQSITIDRRDGHGQWGGRVLVISLHGSQGDVQQVSGDTFRSALGLRSTWFTIGVA